MRLIPRLILTGTLLASPVFAEDDLEFAKALARDGQEELAAEMCDRIEKGAATPEAKAAVALVRAEIMAKAALRKPSLKEAREALDAAAKAFESFAADRPAHPSASEARLRGGIIRRQQGEIAGAEREKEKGATEREKLREEAKRLIRLAVAAFEAVTEGDTAAEAAFEKAKARFAGSRLESDGSKERADALKAALADFEEFEFDFGDSWLLFEASLPWGEVYDQLGRHKEAIARFEVAISLAEAERGPLAGWAREIVLRGYESKAASHVGAKEFNDAVATARAMATAIKDAQRDRSGAMALLHEVDALRLLGRSAEAATRLKALQGPGVPAEIVALVNQKVLDSGIAAPLAQLAVARNALQAGRVDQARRLLRKVWTEADRAKSPEVAADALWMLAQVSDQHEDQPVEAAIRYEEFLEEFPKDARAPRAAFNAARMWNRVTTGTQGWERDQVIRLLKILSERWPQDPSAKDAAFLVAEASFKKGDWARAAAEFSNVPADSTMAELSRVYAGRAWERLGASLWPQAGRQEDAKSAFMSAEMILQRFFDDAAAVSPPEGKREQRKALVLAARETLVDILMHEARKEYAKATLQLNSIVASDPPELSLRRALRHRITVDVAQGFFADAVASADSLLKNFPATPAAAEGARAAARACDEKGEELAGVAPVPGKVPAAAVSLWLDASRLYAAWIENGGSAADPDEAFSTAQRVMGLGALVNGLDANLCPPSDLEEPPERAAFFTDAARILEKIEKPSYGSRVRIALAGALGMAGDWAGARAASEAVVVEEGLLVAGGSLNTGLVRKKPELLACYEEYGHALVRSPGDGPERRASLDAAWRVMAIVADLVEKQTRGWWRCKTGAILVLVERGREGDFEMARMGLESLRSNYPDLDGGRFGMKARVEALEKRVKEAAPR